MIGISYLLCKVRVVVSVKKQNPGVGVGVLTTITKREPLEGFCVFRVTLC